MCAIHLLLFATICNIYHNDHDFQTHLHDLHTLHTNQIVLYLCRITVFRGIQKLENHANNSRNSRMFSLARWWSGPSALWNFRWAPFYISMNNYWVLATSNCTKHNKAQLMCSYYNQCNTIFFYDLKHGRKCIPIINLAGRYDCRKYNMSVRSNSRTRNLYCNISHTPN